MRSSFILFIAILLFPGLSLAASNSEPGPLLPESLAARGEMAANQKTITVFLKHDDPEKLAEIVNTSNSEYAKKGWTVFAISPYMNDGDTEGVFVTYQKKLVIE